MDHNKIFYVRATLIWIPLWSGLFKNPTYCSHNLFKQSLKNWRFRIIRIGIGSNVYKEGQVYIYCCPTYTTLKTIYKAKKWLPYERSSAVQYVVRRRVKAAMGNNCIFLLSTTFKHCVLPLKCATINRDIAEQSVHPGTAKTPTAERKRRGSGLWSNCLTPGLHRPEKPEKRQVWSSMK